ncbi:MAG: hypothetical protein K0U66_01765 [Gammaproteobacteria bacterium]|nr:hypothetical protein [Gammaproteobacteria bacterium]
MKEIDYRLLFIYIRLAFLINAALFLVKKLADAPMTYLPYLSGNLFLAFTFAFCILYTAVGCCTHLSPIRKYLGHLAAIQDVPAEYRRHTAFAQFCFPWLSSILISLCLTIKFAYSEIVNLGITPHVLHELVDMLGSHVLPIVLLDVFAVIFQQTLFQTEKSDSRTAL